MCSMSARLTSALMLLSTCTGPQAGLPRLVLIVGKGLHSRDGVAKLRPAVERLVARHNLRCIPGQPNAGCITAEFVSREHRGIVGWLLDMCVIC